MKPLLGIDVTTDKNNEQMNGTELIVATASKAATQRFEDNQADADELIAGSKMSLPLRVLQTLSGFSALLIAGGIIRASVEIGLSQTYKNAPFLFWIGGICLALFAFLTVYSFKKQKEILNTESANSLAAELDENISALYKELGVPDDAPDVDVLAFRYKIKNGVLKVHTPFMALTSYVNPEMKVHVKDSVLYITDTESSYGIPLSSIEGIRTVNKRISVTSWNKEDDYKEGRFKEYKITENQYGNIFFKPYYILEFNFNGEEYGLYFPCYELPVFEELTGKKATDPADMTAETN